MAAASVALSRLTIAATLCVLATASTLHAQWTVTNLEPQVPDYYGSGALGTSGPQQVGYIVYSGAAEYSYRASLWSGTAESWVDLGESAIAVGVGGTQQVGAYFVDGPSPAASGYRACLWYGTLASMVVLHPDDGPSGSSMAVATSGTHQVGWYLSSACLWRGTAASRVDLSPLGATHSSATAIFGTTQVGEANFVADGPYHAGMWSGTPQSWVDLNPAGATSSSATGVFGTEQVGHATFEGFQHGALWSGSAQSFVDLNPATASQSEVHAIYGMWQAGSAVVGTEHRASLWSGTATSWVDLSAFLPAAFGDSYATGIWSDGASVYVSGWANNDQLGVEQALLWSAPILGLAWSDLGSGLAGASGIPELAGTGTLAAGSAGSLSLTSAHASSQALLFVALASAPAPFKGGVLVANPVTLALAAATDGSGAVLMPFTWPSGVPAATSLYFQFAIQDAAAPHGASLSNALKAVTP